MQANSLFRFKTVLFALFFVVLIASDEHQKPNAPPMCCDQKLLNYDPVTKTCKCNIKEDYYESQDHTHCIHCPKPKKYLNYKCVECVGKFRFWNGNQCQCKAGTLWSQTLKKCICPVNKREKLGTQHCECIPPLVEIHGQCRCRDPEQHFINGKCICKKKEGLYVRKDGSCVLCNKPLHWFARLQKCLGCDDQGPTATQIFDPQTQTCNCNANNPYQVTPIVCQPCSPPGTWDELRKICFCPNNYKWDAAAKKCQCFHPNRIDKYGHCSNCPEGQIFDSATGKCHCPPEKRYFYWAAGQPQPNCHICPLQRPYPNNDGNCSKCPAERPYEIGDRCEKCKLNEYFWGGKCHQCKEGQHYYNKTCHECPQQKPHLINGHCQKCKVLQFSYDDECHKCPKGQYWYQDECHKCAKGQFEYPISGSNQICHQCPKPTPYFYNKKCNKCPQDNPFQHDDHCGGCFPCPQNLPHQYNGACNKCPKDEYQFNGKCIWCKPELYYDGKCHECPKNQQYVDGECKPCKKGLYLVNNKCVKCPKGQYQIKGTCRHCKFGFQYRNKQCLQCFNFREYNPIVGKCICKGKNCYRCPNKGEKYDTEEERCL